MHITIHTDASVRSGKGAWTALIERNPGHTSSISNTLITEDSGRLEITAVISSLIYCIKELPSITAIDLYTDYNRIPIFAETFLQTKEIPETNSDLWELLGTYIGLYGSKLHIHHEKRCSTKQGIKVHKKAYYNAR